jgi:hypothetical protein
MGSVILWARVHFEIGKRKKKSILVIFSPNSLRLSNLGSSPWKATALADGGLIASRTGLADCMQPSLQSSCCIFLITGDLRTGGHF